MTLSFNTARLNVIEVNSNAAKSERTALVKALPSILTPAVVANLPSYFQGIESKLAAEEWLNKMLKECHLLMLQSSESEIIGFLFIYSDNPNAHIGYLLAEQYWGKGLAFELLHGFINLAYTHPQWHKLIAGVDKSNTASVKLLNKLSFIQQDEVVNNMLFYEFDLRKEPFGEE